MKYSLENSFNCKSLTYYKYNCQNILNSENYSSSLKKKKKFLEERIRFIRRTSLRKSGGDSQNLKNLAKKKKNHLDSLDESLDVHDLRRG